MSMYRVEDIGEWVVGVVGESDIDKREKISLIRGIYRHHDRWDVSFTRMRVNPILLETGFFHKFDMDEHPDYGKYKEYFESIRNSSFEWIYEDPVKGYAEGNDINSYWFGPDEAPGLSNTMVCEPGMSSWSILCGDDSYDEMNPAELVTSLMRAALSVENGRNEAVADVFLFLNFISVEEDEYKDFEKAVGSIKLDEGMMAAVRDHPYSRDLMNPDYMGGMGSPYEEYFEWLKDNPAPEEEQAHQKLDGDDMLMFLEIGAGRYHQHILEAEYVQPSFHDSDVVRDYMQWNSEDRLNNILGAISEYMSIGKHLRAAVLADRALKEYPGNRDLTAQRAEAVFRTSIGGDVISEEIADIESLIVNGHDEDAYLHFLKSIGHFKKREKEECIAELKRASELDDKYIELYDSALKEDDW